MNAPVQPTPAPAPAGRVASVDAYRGLVMFLMMAEVLRLGAVHKALPGSEFWSALAHHQEHVAWRGCSLHDLIQPSFSFLVGVALPFSLASRAGRGQSTRVRWLHAFWRAAVLVLLGVFLRSFGQKQTNWTFTDALSQIGLGYVFLFAIGHLRVAWQRAAFAVILIAYWSCFALYPLPAPDFDYAAVGGLPAEERPTGFAAHWDKNTNVAAAFDTWFLNQFPRAEPFTHGKHNRGGYATLNFVPTLATMVLGLVAGGWLRAGGSAWGKVRHFAAVGLALLASGYLLDATGVCPNVKRIWTPAWVLFSGGWCFLLLAGFAVLLDTGSRGGWAHPLVVIGANSIAAYVASWLLKGFVVESFKTHFGPNVFVAPLEWLQRRFGPDVLPQPAAYEPLVSGFAVLTVFWLGLWWMYRRKVFVKV
jgi:heparan-alpha-glucosaminide N-acetyltransferase